MKTVVMTIMALMVATVAAAGQEAKIDAAGQEAKINDELVFTIHKTGNENQGFDVRVKNNGTSAWTCDVDVKGPDIPSDKRSYRNTYVGSSASAQFIGGYSGHVKNLQCDFEKVSCTKKP